MKKMNNKGFSLVELIVVVLIMAIIAVALAPQVMKWVDKSRLSADRETYDNLISNVQVALTDKSLGDTITATKFTITTSATSASAGTDGGDANLIAALNSVNASWTSAKAKRSGAEYSFNVSANKIITRGEGNADPANITYDEADASTTAG